MTSVRIYCPKCDMLSQYVVRNKWSTCRSCDTLLQYQCARCTKMYKNKNAVRCHLKHCNKERKFACSYCDYRTNVKINLISHTKCKHMTVTPVHCPKCGKEFKNNWSMQKHKYICERLM